MPYKTLIAHIDDNNPQRIQRLEEHQINVANIASEFASVFSMRDWGYLAGYYHDIGKARHNFQSYIRKVSGHSPEARWNGADKSHAYIGARLICDDYPMSNPILGMLAMGHHSGLDDIDDYQTKLSKEIPNIDYVKPNVELSLPKAIYDTILNSGSKMLHHLIRMLYSCLVDADFLDTECFISKENAMLRSGKATISGLLPRLDAYLEKLMKTKGNAELNEIRQYIQNICKDKSSLSPGFYSLTVPTGGGKTISSLVWAVNHCIEHNKQRVIIAIPYTSIITQTAQILRSIFGNENVLEHHSEVEYEKIEDPVLRKRLKLATENWDYPIIVTTNVRLIESMMSNKPSKCRKLHNIANSVVIMDEVQTLPICHIQPIIDTLSAYKQLFGVSFLFTTASLPALEGNIRWSRKGRLQGIDEIIELVPQELSLYQKLRRTRILVDNSESSSAEIAQRIANEKRVLCIVNTRKLAKEIFDCLPDEGITIHLSRMMCSAHLNKAITKVKNALKSDVEVIRVVSTQLIEAGVDIDFPVVYRQKSGLDSVIQAAGRCNREGMRAIGNVYVFSHEKAPKGQMRKGQDSFDSISAESDLFAPETMKEYFIQLYSRYENFDVSDISGNLYRNNEWKFETAAKSFRLIDDSYFTVYVNYDEAEQIIEEIKTYGPNYESMRRLSKYSVNIYEKDFKILFDQGYIEEVFHGIFFIPDKKIYNESTGLTFENHWLEEILVI